MEQRSGGPRLQWWNLKAPEWKTAGWLGGLLVLGLILLTARSAGAPAHPSLTASAAPPTVGADPLSAEQAQMDQALTGALSHVSGAGQVTVAVLLASGPTTVYATNDQDSDSTTSETSAGGGLQTTVQHSTTRQLAGTTGGTQPVASVHAPQIQSVLVVATGAVSPLVQMRLAAATQAATGIPLFRITVLPGGGGTGNGGASSSA